MDYCRFIYIAVRYIMQAGTVEVGEICNFKVLLNIRHIKYMYD